MRVDQAAVAVETLSMDGAARAYGAFLRSVRVLRAAVASLIGTTCLFPIVGILYLPLLLTSGVMAVDAGSPGSALLRLLWLFAVLALLVAFFALVSYIYFYAFRTVAKASIRAAWVVLAMVGTMAIVLVSSRLYLIAWRTFWTAPLHDAELASSGEPWLTAPLGLLIFWLLLSGAASLSPMCLVAVGLGRLLRFRRSPLFPLFVDRNFRRKFRPGWTAIVADFRVLMGITTPSRDGKDRRRVMAAALSAFVLEGMAFYWYFHVGSNLLEGPAKLMPYGSPAAAVMLPVLLVAAAFPLVLGAFALSRRLRRYALRRALLSADEARLADPRRPVLFLRSFRDDQVCLAGAGMPWPVRFFDPGSEAGTLEELLVREFAYLGPVVTIGNPSDELPALGAVRKYCSGETWQDVVVSLMNEAALIVVGVDQSPGLIWEIATLRKQGLLGKALFILPPEHPSRRSMLVQLFGLLGIGPETFAPQAALAILFPAPDHALVLTATRPTEVDYQLAIRMPRLAGSLQCQLASPTHGHFNLKRSLGLG